MCYSGVPVGVHRLSEDRRCFRLWCCGEMHSSGARSADEIVDVGHAAAFLGDLPV